MSEKAEVEKVARQVAERFAEAGDRPKQQLERIVELMGPAWTNDIAEQAAREVASAGPLTLRADGTPRTKSGVFFALARDWMVNKVSGGGGDSNRYDADGWMFAQAVRAGDLLPDVDPAAGGSSGTLHITRLTGYLYAVIGRSTFGGFFFSGDGIPDRDGVRREVASWVEHWERLVAALGVALEGLDDAPGLMLGEFVLT